VIPLAVRIAVRNAVGGSGPFSAQQIEDLFNLHEFMEQDESLPEAGGARRATAERFQSRIDWTSADHARVDTCIWLRTSSTGTQTLKISPDHPAATYGGQSNAGTS
jgi:hypothetical protein